MITDNYQPYKEKTRYKGYKAHSELFGLDEQSKLGKFVHWVKNLDADYEVSKGKTAGKVVVAALAVFAMLLSIPLGVGTYLLYKFVSYNCRISDALKLSQVAEDAERDFAIYHEGIITALGGEEACKNIPAVESLDVNVCDGVDPDFTDAHDAATEIRLICHNNQHPVLQVKDHLVALCVESQTTQEKVVCLIYKMSSRNSWLFTQIEENQNEDGQDKIDGFKSSFPAHSIDTVFQLMNGTHEQYRLENYSFADA